MLPTVARTRLARVQDSLERAGADWLVVPASPDFRWLTLAAARVTERLVAVAVSRAGDVFVLAPRLEAGPLAAACPELETIPWDEHEDPLQRLLDRTGITASQSLLLGEGMRVHHVLRLAGLARCRPASEVLGPLRAVKEPAEIEALAIAAGHADLVVQEAAAHARPGMTERSLGHFVMNRFAELGDSDPWVLVASGTNSAEPHHASSDRAIARGEVLLIDAGAWTNGYASDITRTYFLGEPPRQVLRVYDVVNRAREAAIAAVRGGVAAEQVDRAARAVIEDAGLGEHFTHRTGHGIGLEVHEGPFIVQGNTSALAAGQVHSVEPGVYLPGRFGVRLEDIVVVEERGARVITQAPFGMRPPGERS